MTVKKKRVAICAVAQLKNDPDLWHVRFQGMLLEILEDLQRQTGFTYGKGGVEQIVSVSDDFFDARTISNNGVQDVLGGQYLAEEKMAQEGLNAIGYANAIILSGHKDVVLIMGHCKESQGESRNLITNCGFDPFYGRAIGLDYLNAAGLQARAYMDKSGLTEDHLAQIVVRCRQWAAKNPYANARETLSPGKVKASPMLCDPIRQLHAYPVSDGAVGLLLASAERAKDFTDRPVWITGFANTMDAFFFGDRDLTANFALKKATAKACERAGIKNLKEAAQVVEVMDCYAYQQPLWMEGLGFCGDGEGARFIDEGGPGKYRVNLSGGALAGNPMIIAGLYRAVEACLQLKGEAGDHQIPDVQCAVAHATSGPAGQFHSVLILEA